MFDAQKTVIDVIKCKVFLSLPLKYYSICSFYAYHDTEA